MRCYDCSQEKRGDTEVIGVCSRCGLGACEGHAYVRQVHISRVLGGSANGHRPARRVVCRTCDLAETGR